MGGGWSQVDTFDPKPALTKYAGQPIDGKVKGDVIVRQGSPGPLMPISNVPLVTSACSGWTESARETMRLTAQP